MIHKWHCLAVKKSLALLRGTSSRNNGNFYCWSCLHSFRTKSKLEPNKKVYVHKDFSNVIIPSENTEILEFSQYQKSDKTRFIIYADLKCLLEKIDGCKNNPQNSFTRKVSKHVPSGFSISAKPSFRGIEIKITYSEVKTACKSYVIS